MIDAISRPSDHDHGDLGGARPAVSAAEARAAKKELARLERQLHRLEQREAELHDQLATHATDYEKVSTLDAALREVRAERARVEEEWLTLADAHTD
jgi:ATP-binding cassette subfamily F protein uup